MNFTMKAQNVIETVAHIKTMTTLSRSKTPQRNTVDKDIEMKMQEGREYVEELEIHHKSGH